MRGRHRHRHRRDRRGLFGVSGKTGWATYVKDAGIGFLTESVGGLFDNTLVQQIGYDAAGSFLDSVFSQAADNNWSINFGMVSFDTVAGGELGAFGNVGKIIGPLAGVGEDLAYNIVYGVADLGSSACNNYASEVEGKGC